MAQQSSMLRTSMSRKVWGGLVCVGVLASGLIVWQQQQSAAEAARVRAAAEHSTVRVTPAVLTPAEVQRQVREALDKLMQSSITAEVQAAATQLAQLNAHASLASAGKESRAAILAHLLQGRLQWMAAQTALVQERDSALAAWHQGDLAVEMIISPLCGGDPYLKAVYGHYRPYAVTISEALSSLFAGHQLGPMQQQAHQIAALEAIMQDDLRVLALESPALRDHAQYQAGLRALQGLLQPEQGVVDRWLMLQQQAGLLRVSADKLQQLMQPVLVTSDRGDTPRSPASS